MTLPRYISARDIALALGPAWSSERVVRALRKMGIAKQIPGVRGWFVTPSDLAGEWPDQYEDVLARLSDIKPTKEKPRHKGWTKGANKQVVSKETRVKTDTTIHAYVCEHVWDDNGVCGCGAFWPGVDLIKPFDK